MKYYLLSLVAISSLVLAGCSRPNQTPPTDNQTGAIIDQQTPPVEEIPAESFALT